MQYEKTHIRSDVPTTEVRQPVVLIVDDNEHLLKAVGKVLDAQGYEVLAAQSAGQALFYLDQHIPDVIVCDVMMPGMDGYEFQECVKEKADWCVIPFIFLTALSEPEEVRYGKRTGCDDYLTKPFLVEDLVSVIEGKLAVSDARKDLNFQKLETYRRRIVHTLSHEFRTPLVAINTGTELLLEQTDGLEQDRMEHLLRSIQRGGHRLQRLVEDFMTLQQIDSGAAESVRKRLSHNISPRELIEKAIDEFLEDYNGERKGVQFVVAIGDPEPASEIFICTTQVINALHRILDNAEKFSRKDGQVEISASEEEEDVIISVRDAGPGLSPEAREQAKQVFAQIGREKFEQQGCGLGLTIANYFIDLNEGTIVFVEPKDGNGLEVQFRFPKSRA